MELIIIRKYICFLVIILSVIFILLLMKNNMNNTEKYNNDMLANMRNKVRYTKNTLKVKIKENMIEKKVVEEQKEENKNENNNTTENNKVSKKGTTNKTETKNTTEEKSDNKQTKEKAVFTSSKIPDSILKRMIGKSIPEKNRNDVNTDNLRYLQITYWGFDEKSHVGEMIVSKKVAQEILEIFKDVYEKKYPIEKMKLIDDYGADDEKSMQSNNTSAFCYRVVANTKTLSKHALGTAIDINPLYNPYVVGNYISPSTGKKYADRSIVTKGTIKKGDALYNAFIKRGWSWGGNWKSKKDYQHFEK